MQAKQGQRPVPAQGEEGALPVASPRQPARPERAAERPALGNDPGRRRHQRDQPQPRSRPAPSASCPPPGGTGFEDARQAVLIERYTTYKKKGQWLTRAEAVLYITSLGAEETTPEDLLAHARGHWRVEHAHWLRPRCDLERRQITHPNRKRTPDLVRPHQPRHHPFPHTRSNQLHRRNPPLRTRPPPRPAIPRPDRTLTRLNTARDFDESLPGPGDASRWRLARRFDASAVICFGRRQFIWLRNSYAGWSSSVARWAHNPEVAGSNPAPATKARGPLSNRKRASRIWFVHGFAHGRLLTSRPGSRRSVLNEGVTDDQHRQGGGHLTVGVEVGLQILLHGERHIRVSYSLATGNNEMKIRSGNTSSGESVVSYCHEHPVGRFALLRITAPESHLALRIFLGPSVLTRINS